MAVISALLTPAAQAAPQREGIAALVGDDVITYSDLRNRIQMVLTTTKIPNDPQVMKRLETQVLDSLINESLQMQEATRLGVEIKNDQFEQALDQVARQNKTTAASLKSELEMRNVPFSTLEAQIKSGIPFEEIRASWEPHLTAFKQLRKKYLLYQ